MDSKNLGGNGILILVGQRLPLSSAFSSRTVML